MKKFSAFTFAILLAGCALGQSIWVIDFVEVKNGHQAEVEYFINENWKTFREAALKKGVIKSYRVLRTSPDSTAAFSYMMMTEFADSTSFRNVEENFRPIMKAVRPNGPKFLNDLRPKDFWSIPVSKEAQQMIGSEK